MNLLPKGNRGRAIKNAIEFSIPLDALAIENGNFMQSHYAFGYVSSNLNQTRYTKLCTENHYDYVLKEEVGMNEIHPHRVMLIMDTGFIFFSRRMFSQRCIRSSEIDINFP